MTIRNALLDKLLKGCQKPEDLLGESGILKQLTKALVDRCMQSEMTHHLGYAKNDHKGKHSGNHRNGSYQKTVVGEHGEMAFTVPRDRKRNFEPRIVPKGTSRLNGFDDKIISLYTRGMTTRDIQGHLHDQSHRVAEHVSQESDEKSGFVSH